MPFGKASTLFIPVYNLYENKLKHSSFSIQLYAKISIMQDVGPPLALMPAAPLGQFTRVELEAELLKSRQEVAKLRTQLASTSRIAFTDALTQLPNRHGYERYVQALQALVQTPEFQTSIGQGRIGGILVAQVDIDHFKSVNSMVTHFGGDMVLKQFAERLARCTRVNALDTTQRAALAGRCIASLIVESHLVRSGMTGSDLISRWGGEEFFCIFPLCYRDPEAAAAVYDAADMIVQRLLNCIRREPLIIPVNDSTYDNIKQKVIGNPREYYQHVQLIDKQGKQLALPLSASVGYTVINWQEFTSHAQADPSHLFRNVVDLMRRAKETGRNRAVTVRARAYDNKPSIHIFEGRPLDKTSTAELMG